MNEIWHIFRKDVRRLCWALVGWAFIVVGRLAVTTAGVPAAFGELRVQLVVENVTLLLASLDMLMLALLISWLVHDEPLVGLDAFWLTRPIDRTRLMTAKLIFAAIFLVGVPVAGQAATAALAGHGWSGALRTIPAAAFAEAGWTLAFMVLAVLTPTLMAFLLAIAGSVAGLAVILSGVTTVLLLTRSDETLDFRPSPIMDFTGGIVAAWAMLATALAVVVFQYRRRHVVRAIAVGVVGIAAAFVLSSAWPWRFAKAQEPDPGAWAQDERRTTAVIDAGVRPYVSERPAFSERSAAKKTIAMPLRFTNVPPDVSLDSFVPHARLALPGGVTLQSASFGSVAVPRRGLDAAAVAMGNQPTTRVQAALPNVHVPNPDPVEHDYWPVVLTIGAKDFSRLGEVSGQLTADVEAFMYRSRVAGTMPLVESAAIQVGSTRFALVRVLPRSDGCSVLVRQSTVPSFGRPSPPRTYELALWNRSHGEAIAGNTEYFPVTGGLRLGNWFVPTPEGGPGSVYVAKRYSEAPSESAMHLDSSWLDRAELAVVETAYAGRLSRSITIDDFRMRR